MTPNLTYFLTFAASELTAEACAESDKLHIYPGAFVFAFLFSATFSVIYAYEHHFLHHDDPIYTRERIVQAEFDRDVLQADENDRKINKFSSYFLGVILFVLLFPFLLFCSMMFFAVIF